MAPNILKQPLSQEWALYAHLLSDHQWITECGVFTAIMLIPALVWLLTNFHCA